MYLNSITSNVTLHTLTKLNTTSANVSETLASGKRINRASDDAAGSAISQNMTKQVNGLRQSSRNSSDGLSLAQTFGGSLDNIQNILQRMRELTIQSSTGTYSNSDRLNLNNEFQQLSEEITRISDSTKFNGKAYFGADSGTVNILLSDDITDTMDITFQKMDSSSLFNNATVDVLNQDNARNATDIVDTALEKVINHKSDLGSYMNRLSSNINEVNNTSINLADARSRIEDVDLAKATSEFAKTEILTSSTLSILNKTNQIPQNIVKLLF